MGLAAHQGMYMRLFVSMMGLSLAVATAAFAQAAPDSSAAPAAPAAPAPQKKADGIVCRQETPTGSHFPVKVCTTAAERADQRKQAMRMQEKIQMPSDRLPN